MCLLTKIPFFLKDYCFIAAGIIISPLPMLPFLSTEGKEKKKKAVSTEFLFHCPKPACFPMGWIHRKRQAATRGRTAVR